MLTVLDGPTPMSPPRQRGAGGGGYYRNSSYGIPHQDSVMEDPQETQYYARSTQQMRQPLQPHHNNAYANSYPQDSHHSHQQSYETMTSGSDENSKSTNPSSLNSSYDQLHQLHKPMNHSYPQQQNQYVGDMPFAPVSPQKPYDAYGRNGNYGMPNGQHQYGGPVRDGPAPPPKMNGDMGYNTAPNNPRKPIKLDTGATAGAPPALTKTDSNSGKRQSWLKRKFSKKGRD